MYIPKRGQWMAHARYTWRTMPLWPDIVDVAIWTSLVTLVIAWVVL